VDASVRSACSDARAGEGRGTRRALDRPRETDCGILLLSQPGAEILRTGAAPLAWLISILPDPTTARQFFVILYARDGKGAGG